MNLYVDKLQGYGDMSAEAVAAVHLATRNPRQHRARVDLIREGDRPGPVFIVLDGWVCRYKILPAGTRQILAFLLPGDACDLHIGLLAEMDHGIQTVTAATVATVSRADMDALMYDHPDLARTMYVAQLVDEGVMRAWITSMGRRSSTERVAHLMCELYIRARNIGIEVEPHLSLPLSQLILADALGMTPVHINRVLRDLRLMGAMTLQRGQLIIVDAAQLAKIAGFDENYLHRRLRVLA